MARRGGTEAVIVAALAVLSGACSADRAVPSGRAGTVTVAGPRGRSLERFVHPSGWSIDSPGTMIASDNNGAAFVGFGELLRVTPLAGSTAPGRVAVAEASLSLGANFALSRGPHAVRVGGRVASEYEYQEDAGTEDAVIHGVRLYVAFPGGVYRVEHVVTGIAWDPQSGSDIVATFRVGGWGHPGTKI